MNRTQITGLGPVMADGSRKIFDKEPKPFIATKEWLDAQTVKPAMGDYLEIAEDGSVTVVAESSVRAAAPNEPNEPMAAPAQPVREPDAEQSADQKKTAGEKELANGSDPAPTHRAKPIEVYAYEIVSVADEKNEDGSLNLALSNGVNVKAEPEMLARILPKIGDYWVIQRDGYVYLNPKEVFERKYERITE